MKRRREEEKINKNQEKKEREKHTRVKGGRKEANFRGVFEEGK